MKPEFPISVRFEDGEVVEYADAHDLIHNLEAARFERAVFGLAMVPGPDRR